MPAAELQELRDLTDHGNRFHHDSNPQAYLTVVVTDAELQGYRSCGSPVVASPTMKIDTSIPQME
jgi:hypothetical protein